MRGHRDARLPRGEAEARPPPHGEGRLRPHRPGHPPRPHRADAQDEAVPGPRPPPGLRDRGLHGDDRRPHRPLQDASTPQPRGDRAQRRYVQEAGLQDPRPCEDGDPLQPRVARCPGLGRVHPARRHLQRGAHARAARVPPTLRRGPADITPRVPLSDGPGLRLGGLECRRGARRHGPALQPQRRPRHHARLRPRAPGRADDAAARGHRRRREDVEEPRQLRGGERAAR